MNKKQQIIEVVPYNSEWPKQFTNEAELLRTLFSKNFISVYHIGSTAIPKMPAKPTIDILLEVKNIDHVDALNQEMTNMGYEAWGEYGISGRRFFLKGNDKRTHHVHVFETESFDITRHLYFRDYLIAHPNEANTYASLKLDLAKKYKHNRRAYRLGKQNYVIALEKRAVAWAKALKK